MSNKLLPCPVCGKTDCEAMQMYDFPKYPPEIQAVLTAAKVLTIEDNWSRINLLKLVVAIRDLEKKTNHETQKIY